jgi:hypothetical protein
MYGSKFRQILTLNSSVRCTRETQGAPVPGACSAYANSIYQFQSAYIRCGKRYDCVEGTASALGAAPGAYNSYKVAGKGKVEGKGSRRQVVCELTASRHQSLCNAAFLGALKRLHSEVSTLNSGSSDGFSTSQRGSLYA